MSVMLTVAANQAPFAPLPALAPMPWTPSASEARDNLELSGAVMHFAADRPIYAEGDEARSFYKVLSGMVRTCRFLNDGRRQIDAFHAAGDVFGIEAGDSHRLGAEAVSECCVIAYRRRGLEAMMFQNDKLGRWFFSHALAMVARAREHSLLLGRGTAAQKISVFLLEIETQQGRAKSVDLVMSRRDIADYLALTIETVSRTLSQMERDGTIGLTTARRVILKDRRTLWALNS
jgi:CRP/FNR family nitrogen fixation transcriptional regulator